MKEARKKLEEIGVIVRAELIQKVQKMLRDHSNLDEFVMGMGTWFFRRNDGEFMDDDSTKYLEPIGDLIGEWNDALHLTGEPMIIKANGDILTDW